jgi:DNA damage-binding protein 1
MFIAQHLSIAPRTSAHPEDRLIVGDGKRSVFVLDVDEGSGQIFGDQRDMATHSVMGMERITDGGSGVVISDVSESRDSADIRPILISLHSDSRTQ